MGWPSSSAGRPEAGPMAEPVCQRLAIIGCGLIGSSVARAARTHGAVNEIAVFDPSAQVRDRVEALGLADAVHDSGSAACEGADLVLFAAPPLSIGPAARAAAP